MLERFSSNPLKSGAKDASNNCCEQEPLSVANRDLELNPLFSQTFKGLSDVQNSEFFAVVMPSRRFGLLLWKDRSEVFGEEIQSDKVLRVDVGMPFLCQMPMDGNHSGSDMVFPLIYSYLFVMDNGELEPDLAVKWIYDPQTFSWIITLRDDALFHDGRRVTSADVKYSLQCWEKSRPALFAAIKRIDILSDVSFKLFLNKDDPKFLQMIWSSEITASKPETAKGATPANLSAQVHSSSNTGEGTTR